MCSKNRFLPRIAVKHVAILTGIDDLEPCQRAEDESIAIVSDSSDVLQNLLLPSIASILGPMRAGADVLVLCQV
jgi:hypothetical protein